MRARYARAIRAGINAARQNVNYVETGGETLLAAAWRPEYRGLQFKAYWRIWYRFYPEPAPLPLPPVPGKVK